MIVTITNQKGGCGKTTTAITLSAGLKAKGYRVLSIDADPQTNLTYSAGCSQINGNLYDLLTGSKEAKECISKSSGQYDIIAGSIDLAMIDNRINANTLKNALQGIYNDYDHIVIDTPPQLGMITANALIASNAVIIPVCADIYSIQGLSQLQGMIANAKNVNESLYIDGLLITRFSSRTIINRQIETELQKIAERLGTKVYKARIREATAIKESQLIQSDIFTDYPKANVTKDYTKFIEEYLKGSK